MKSQRWVYSRPVPVTGLPWFRANEAVVYMRHGLPWRAVEVNIRVSVDQFVTALGDANNAIKQFAAAWRARP